MATRKLSNLRKPLPWTIPRASAPKGCVPKHGNFHMKSALYMPALNLLIQKGRAAATYRRLLARGLTHPQAIIPLLHRQLFYIVAVLKRGSAWQAEPPKRD